jgi:hypothetical protein
MQPHSRQLGQQLLALGCRLRTKVAVCCCVGHRRRHYSPAGGEAIDRCTRFDPPGYWARHVGKVIRVIRGDPFWARVAASTSPAQQFPFSAMKPGVGRVQKAIRRAFRARPGHSFTTRELLAWSHPRGARRPLHDRRNCCRAIRHAADQPCVRVGRLWPDGVLWKWPDPGA